MISVLIPTYNYNVNSLVKSVHQQLIGQNVIFEIICFDNGSNSKTNTKNEELNKLKFCRFTSLNNDVGRSKIRNLLADSSKYDWLLFLDADVLPVSDTFIEKYLECIYKNQKVVYGGLKYEDIKPSDDRLLRWVYGKDREEISLEKRNLDPRNNFSSANFLIKKKIFNSYRFNEELTKYGHEDTLLGLELVRNNIEIVQIDNPVYHLGLDINKDFLQKTRTGLENLYRLQEQGKITKADNKLLKRFFDLKKLNAVNLIRLIYTGSVKRMEKNLDSKHPSLFIYDLYKLGYFCTLTSN